MRASVFMARGGFAPEIEGRQQTAADGKANTAAAFRRLSSVFRPPSSGPVLPFGLPRLDAVLGGGLRRAAIHEIHCGESRNAGMTTGFAVAVLSRLAAGDRRPLLWVVEATSANESGFPYAAGLARFGLPSDRLIVARVKKPVDALWVFEEGLRCRGLSAVLAEIAGNPRQLDLTASRRLALRAGEHSIMGLLLRQSGNPRPSAAATRWLVTPRPAATTDDYPAGIGNPSWRLTLERNRYGATGVFDVEWNHERGTFVAAAGPAHSVPVAAVSSDRPSAPADIGEVVALVA